jgi:hypothetical protein
MSDTKLINQIDTGLGSESHSGLEKCLVVSLVKIGAFMGCLRRSMESAK